MISSTPQSGKAPVERRRNPAARGRSRKTLAIVIAIVLCVLWVHVGSGLPTFHSQGSSEAGWSRFRGDYGIDEFGADGQFVRAVQNGYNLFFHTYKYAPRFTRKVGGDAVNSCSGCHTADDLAYAFVNSDRFDRKLGRRVSFEERVQRCYVGAMDGYIPTIYDPALRDIRLLARAVAHHLQLSEGAVRRAP